MSRKIPIPNGNQAAIPISDIFSGDLYLFVLIVSIFLYKDIQSYIYALVRGNMDWQSQISSENSEMAAGKEGAFLQMPDLAV